MFSHLEVGVGCARSFRLSQPRPPGTVGTSTIAPVPFPMRGLILPCPPICTIKSEPQTQLRTSACSLLLGNALWGASVGQDGPQGGREWRSIWINALPCHPLGASAFPASCSSSCFSLGLRCKRCEVSNALRVAQPFVSPAEQFSGPLLLLLLFPGSEREREREREREVGCQGLLDHLQGLWGGGQAGLSQEFLLSLAISRFAELDVRLSGCPQQGLAKPWALEQVCTHGPLP